ncbi:hypothetical protein ABIB39_001377 [Mucilaginibacter sp. UYP27]
MYKRGIVSHNLLKHKNMAKKVVATLKVQGKGKEFSKVITMNKSPRTGAYSFKEQIVPNDNIKDAIAGKQ